ncbi:MAG: PQQ-dependent sugar dehydrogenase [Patescibacteria group bacterium]
MTKNTRSVLIVGSIVVLAAAGYGAYFAYRNLRGAGPAIKPLSADITELLNVNTSGNTNTSTNVSTQVTRNTTGFPLTLPAGYSIRVLEKNLPSARDIALDSNGNVWVSQLAEGKVVRLDMQNDSVTKKNEVFTGLGNPHGLAFDPADPKMLYVAQERSLSRAEVSEPTPKLQKILDLPNGNNHNRRTLAFGPDGKLYVSIGSTCNVCKEDDARSATVYSLNKDGSDFKVFATGLRNAAFLAIRPADGKLWATENGRDLIGDDIPPDEVNIVEHGKFYGWPYCYGKNVQDTSFDRSSSAKERCTSATPSHINLQAHSAPLGLAFIPDTEAWPADWRGDLLVAFHGSWNRTDPTGYMLVRIDINADGSAGETYTFISGWLTKAGGALGRPVDVLPTEDGKLYITDDKAGLVYIVEKS